MVLASPAKSTCWFRACNGSPRRSRLAVRSGPAKKLIMSASRGGTFVMIRRLRGSFSRFPEVAPTGSARWRIAVTYDLSAFGDGLFDGAEDRFPFGVGDVD